MSLAALILGFFGAVILALPPALHLPVELHGPFSAPLGGGLCVAALVLAAATALSPRRRARAPRRAAAALLLAVAGVGVALGTEWRLIRREREERARAVEPARPTEQRAREDRQFDDELKDNLNR